MLNWRNNFKKLHPTWNTWIWKIKFWQTKVEKQINLIDLYKHTAFYVSRSNVSIGANRMSAAERLGILIGNNRDGDGILKNGEEYLISQYADATPIFTNGSPKSLNKIPRN